MSTTAVTTTTFGREVLASELPVIVDFWAPWCAPCRAVAPVLDQIAAERTDELKVVRVDIDEQPELAAYFGVSSIPTIVLFKRGMPVAGAVGARSKPQLESALGLRQITDGNHSAEARGLRRLIARLSVRRA